MFQIKNIYINTNQIICIQIPSFSKILDISYNENGIYDILIESKYEDNPKEVFIYVVDKNFLHMVPNNFEYLKTIEHIIINPRVSIDFNCTPFGNISYDYIKYYVFIDNNQTPQEKRDKLINKIINNQT